MQVKNTLKITASYIIVILAALVMAFNYHLFVFPNRFAPAGLNGIFTMLQHMFGIKLGYTTIILNVPLAIASFFINSKPRALRTLTYSLAFSTFLTLLERLDLSMFVYATTSSTILGPLVAGLITGFCGYMLYKVNACYGGTEFIAGFIHKYKPNVNFFNIIFVLNITVAAVSYFVYGYNIEPVLLCILYCYTSSNLRDSMSRKYQSAVRCEIITNHPDEMNKAIIDNLHHTATVISGKGAYTGSRKSILLCIVNPSQVSELARLAAQFPDSFVIVSSATRVLGNFKRLDSHGNPELQLYDGGVKTENK